MRKTGNSTVAPSEKRTSAARSFLYECLTHFTSSGKVGLFPYMRMPTR